MAWWLFGIAERAGLVVGSVAEREGAGLVVIRVEGDGAGLSLNLLMVGGMILVINCPRDRGKTRGSLGNDVTWKLRHTVGLLDGRV